MHKVNGHFITVAYSMYSINYSNINVLLQVPEAVFLVVCDPSMNEM
jgi:hypothetical protein